MKRLLLAFALSLIGSQAWAVCGAIPLPVKDANNATQNISSATAADGNCKTYVDADSASTLVGAINNPATLGSASGGLSTNLQSALSTTVVAVDASAGQLYELYCYNPNGVVGFVQLFDAATGSVTLGTTTPKLSYGIPATNASGFTLSLVGVQFSTAISAAATTTATGNTALGTGLVCNFKYK